MKIIGLTGGIASGKSTVSCILSRLGALIIDADKIAREVVEPGEKALGLIVREFGDNVLKSNGTLNRKALGNIVFNDPKKLSLLNEITHPEIRKRILEYIKRYTSKEENRAIIIDAAVLIESGMHEFVDEVWLVYVDYKTQLSRLMERDNLDLKEAEARIKSQMPVEDKIKLSHKVIDNTGDIAYTEHQVKKLWTDIMN